MKRIVAAAAVLGLATSLTAPASAAGVTVYGSAKLTYTVAATAAVSIAVNYDASGNYGTAASSILPSAVTAGICTAGIADGATGTLTFGAITPPASGYTGCYYKNALSIGVESNDAAGVKVLEYSDTAVAGTAICVVQTDAAPVVTKPTQSSVTGNPAAYTGAACAVGTALTYQGAATAGTGFGAAGVPAGVTTDVTATPTATTSTGTGLNVYTGTGVSGAAFKFMGQDIQMNVSGAAPSGAQTNIITVAVIPQ